MKKITVAISAVAGAILMSGMVNAAEIYNKDGNKLDLYGKVEGSHHFTKNPKDDGDQSYARLGFRGETQISDQVTGFGQWEYNINAKNTENSEGNSSTRLAFAGLKFGDYGSIDYGRNYGVLYDVEAWTDVLPAFGGNTYTQTDNFMTGRTNGVVTYRNSDFFGLVNGLDFALQYQGKNGGESESNNGRVVENQNGDGFGLSATYNVDGFSAGTAYSVSDRTNAQQTETYNDGKHAEAWTAGLKYDANNIYLAAMYARTRNMTWVDISKDSRIAKDLGLNQNSGAFTKKTDNWELVAQYQFDFGLRPSIAYLQSKARDTGYEDVDLVKYTDIGATYYFNKNMSAYVDYKINLLNKNNPAGLNTDNIVATGLVYQF
ncbi:TPA: porin OmpC [Salmonella enterica subsp. enterica serovar Eastbourne]|uniref:Porin OmpC n=2 Tax=Salmonella enterica TaxID=28901 RepID=A0A765BLU6_SALER|nr:porin [Salmonella enterica subsp. enterica serovar Eastbourne]HAG1883165.1 porin OmpC [Salmonella enterica]HAC6678810.1 porin OmpC [Salmonella enterica subsp. enterica serovar Eastbourne]HAE5116294.1 porin OmpC [Salmonella enterica subsp. enterica serovar Eastbourne]HAE8030673.1 porin OmpC [Salmonella enterica subsp. enterica serovar Eastbourne]